MSRRCAACGVWVELQSVSLSSSGIRERHCAAALDRMAAAAMLPQRERDARCGARRRRARPSPYSMTNCGENIVRRAAMDGRRIGGKRGAAIGHGGEQLVIDRDERCRVLGQIAAVGDDDRPPARRHAPPRRPPSGTVCAPGDRPGSASPRRAARRARIGRRSASVRTAWMPGAASAALVSMARMRACACGLLTNAASAISPASGCRRRSARARAAAPRPRAASSARRNVSRLAWPSRWLRFSYTMAPT